MVEITAALQDWYDRYGRHGLPWRTRREPYRVVVSEFMLQQTQVDRVRPLFEAFVARWPDFDALAGASVADVLRLWKGLGYNSRAVRLHALARTVVERYGGTLPADAAALATLPGVGAYTLAAIRAFAFDERVVALDTNIRRIVHRVRFGLEWPPLADGAALAAAAAELASAASGGFALNSALMDLGATICTARTPKCLLCPLQRDCAAAPIDPRMLAARAAAYAKPRSPQERIAFERTTRYLRARIVDRLRDVREDEALEREVLLRDVLTIAPHRDADECVAAIDALVRDRLVERVGSLVRLAR